MENLARGYIASGVFNGNRVPQHIQNQIIRLYCDSIGLEFVLSRAEYWINGSTECQLWAALNEGYKHIVFYSLWQLPNDYNKRQRIYQHCQENNIELHFAAERMNMNAGHNAYKDIETLIQVNLMITEGREIEEHLELVEKLI